MENKHIQNNRNENNIKNNAIKNTEKIYIEKNEYIKNENNFRDQKHVHADIHYNNIHKERHSHKPEEVPGDQHTHTHVDANGNVYTHTHTHSPKIVKNELNRIARIIGHMKSIKIMIESGRDCSEVLIQLAAVDAAVKSLSRVILKEHMSTCIVDAIKTGDEEAIEALNEAIDKFMK
nr:metal-sensing transcriptional repressor [uncultured Anaerobutyricum sp.]